MDNMVAERECGNIGTVYYTRVPQPNCGYFILIVLICFIQIYFDSYFIFISALYLQSQSISLYNNLLIIYCNF